MIVSSGFVQYAIYMYVKTMDIFVSLNYFDIPMENQAYMVMCFLSWAIWGQNLCVKWLKCWIVAMIPV